MIIYCIIYTKDLKKDYCVYLQNHGASISGVLHLISAYCVTMNSIDYEALCQTSPEWVIRIKLSRPAPVEPITDYPCKHE